MSARIIEFRPAKSGRYRGATETASAEARLSPSAHPFEFWCGSSGSAYVHSVYSLLECPEPPAANYVLARRSPSGHRQALRIGRVENDAISLNLAEIRHLGALLGANEVHVHLLGDSAHRRRMIELDIAAAEDHTCRLRAANS